MAEEMTKKIKILHIIKDDKFFDSVIKLFESDSRLDNKSILPVQEKENYIFRRIRNTDIVELVNISSLKNVFKNKEYDVIFFHSLPIQLYKYIPLINEDIIVIWWAWGYDIYNSAKGMSPIIPMQLYKPKTKLFLMSINKGVITFVKKIISECIISYYYNKLRDKVLERIDYFQPVLPLEYELMCNVKGFKAKEFYYPSSFSYRNIEIPEKIVDGNIFLGHSLSPNNNHLDVWCDIKRYIPNNRNVIIPISYGSNKQLASELLNKIQSKKCNIVFLKDFLTINEYIQLLNEASYAVYGIIRQEAMGNIYHCLRSRIKVFLYKDSLVYRFLKNNGYVVYAIEDINENSFNEPLSLNEHEQNIQAYKKQSEYINLTSQKALDEIIYLVKKSKI